MTDAIIELEKELNSLDQSEINQMNAEIPSASEIDKWIARQSFSADTKAILSKIAMTTATAGAAILRVGQIVFKTIMSIVSEFQNAVVGVVVGGIITLLVSSIPIFGGLLGAFLGPLLIALGLGVGALNDLKDKALERRISEKIAGLGGKIATPT